MAPFVPGRRQVPDVAGIAAIEQPLVVRRGLGLGQNAVGPGLGGLDLGVRAEADRDTGDDAGALRPAFSAALVILGAM